MVTFGGFGMRRPFETVGVGIGFGAAVHRLGFGALLKGECRERLSGRSCMKMNFVSMGMGFMWMGCSGLP